MQTGPDESGRVRKRRILRGVICAFLALGQVVFVFVFAYRFYIISNSALWTIDSRWVFPVVALVSCLAFAFEAWTSIARTKGVTDRGSGRQSMLL